jgi:hypothetical protein
VPANESPIESYFLSYSRSDERFALRFAKDLRSRGVAMWVDQLDIRPSEHWDRAIERAVRDCQGLVVILSPRSVASDNVADEISYAIDNRKSVLPVMIEKCSLPLRITRMHVIDASAGYERAVDQCVAEIERACSGARPTTKPVVAPGLDPKIIETVKQQLASIIGPIATIIVDNAARRVSTANELYSLVTQHIDDRTDRARFASLAGRADRGPPKVESPATDPASAGEGEISSVDVDKIAKALTRYLGPIAPILARRESHVAQSIDDFRRRLADLIPNEHDRADFLKAFKDR